MQKHLAAQRMTASGSSRLRLTHIGIAANGIVNTSALLYRSTVDPPI